MWKVSYRKAFTFSKVYTKSIFKCQRKWFFKKFSHKDTKAPKIII